MADRTITTFQKDRRRRGVGAPRRFRLKKALAPADAVVAEAGTSGVRFFGPTVELLVELSPDHTAYVLIDLDDVLDNPDWFEEVDEDGAPMPVDDRRYGGDRR